MGLFDTLLKNPQALGDVARFAADNPQIAKAAMSLLSRSDTSVGDSNGLAGILGSLESGGLGDAVSSWLGSGDNKAVEATEVAAALDSDTLSSFAKSAGIDVGDAGAVLAGMLPGLVDKLSPDGKMPQAGGLDNLLAGMLGGS